MARFQSEAEAVAQLDHPHIVPIYEVGQYRGQHFFSMKLVAGTSLDKRLDEFAADPRAAATLVAVAAEAVHHAHQRGILHRDLKPANILLDERDQPYVTDFGLAKRIDAGNELSHSGTLVGTPAYMSPEQATQSRGSLSTATDVYGLGTILYAALSGRAPFAATTLVETLDMVRTQSPEPPSLLNPRVPRDLEIICLKCLEKEPRRRYQSAFDLAEDLQRWLKGIPILARPVGPLTRAGMWCRRNKALDHGGGPLCAGLRRRIRRHYLEVARGRFREQEGRGPPRVLDHGALGPSLARARPPGQKPPGPEAARPHIGRARLLARRPAGNRGQDPRDDRRRLSFPGPIRPGGHAFEERDPPGHRALWTPDIRTPCAPPVCWPRSWTRPAMAPKPSV